MSKLRESQHISDAIRDIFRMDEMGAVDSLDITEGDSEGEWEVTFKVLGVPVGMVVRALKENDGYKLEYCAYEDHWEEFRSYDYTAARPVLSVLFDACKDIRKFCKVD